jgi:hypothetical protein
MQGNFDSMRQQVEHWRMQQLSVEARLTIYRAFIQANLKRRNIWREVCNDLYFHPQHEEFAPRTMGSLANAITSACKELDPIPQFKTNAVSDISGFRGQAIMRGLLAGERDPKALAKLRDPPGQASEQEKVRVSRRGKTISASL